MTENGLSVPGESAMPLDQALNDQERIDYLKVRTFYVCIPMYAAAHLTG